MHIIAIAWIYVVFMMAITEKSVVAGVMTFTFYCVIPLGVIWYLLFRKKINSPSQTSAITDQSNRHHGETGNSSDNPDSTN
ncbi:ABC-type transport system involved in cytochrome c biogenesis permease subunit [Oxalobacteraceae bacterium GrIS 2.11]